MGVPDIDDQHKLMLGVLKNIGDAALISDGGAETLEILKKYLENMEQHFSYEEGVLERCNYPGIEDHKADHERHLKAVKSAISTLESYDGDAVSRQETVRKIRNNLQDLFTQHLISFDMDYKWFLRDQGMSDPKTTIF